VISGEWLLGLAILREELTPYLRVEAPSEVPKLEATVLRRSFV
jgi:hypothetical protein